MDAPFTRIPFSAPQVSFPNEADTLGHPADSSRHTASKVLRHRGESKQDAIRSPAAVRQGGAHCVGEWSIPRADRSGPGHLDIDCDIPPLYSCRSEISTTPLPSPRVPARPTCWSAPPKKQQQPTQTALPAQPRSARHHVSRRSANSSHEGRPRAPLSAVPSRSLWRHDSAGWLRARPETKRCCACCFSNALLLLLGYVARYPMLCRVQSAYENHKDEAAFIGERDARQVCTENKVVYSSNGFEDHTHVLLQTSGAQTDCEVGPPQQNQPVQPQPSAKNIPAIPGVYARHQGPR